MADAEKKPDENGYFIPAQSISVSTEIKHSRFIAYITQCSDSEAAHALIKQQQQTYPDARHHCWAFIAGAPNSTQAIRCSDDGEPSGTAGKPILNVLQHSHYGDIIAIVSRYFGGIKLGAGGLVRAYSQSTQNALEQLPVIKKRILSQCRLSFPYCHEADVRHYLEASNSVIIQAIYQEQVQLDVALEALQQETLLSQLQNLCKGNLIIHRQTGDR